MSHESRLQCRMSVVLRQNRGSSLQELSGWKCFILTDEFLESIKLIRSQTAFCLLYFSLGKSHNTGVIDGVYKPILCLYVFGNEF